MQKRVPNQSVADGFPGRILLVGGLGEDRTRVLALLGGAGGEIESAECGAAALGRLEQEQFDLILVDVQMPDMDGYEATRRIRALEAERAHSRVPIIALGLGSPREQGTRCLDAGFDARVAKPVDEQALLEAILGCAEELRIEFVPEIADLLPDYLAHRRADADALWKAISDGNWMLVSRLGHDMKGSGNVYGLPRVSEIGARIEASGRANDPREASLALAALERFLGRAARRIVDQAVPPGAPGVNAPRPPSG